MVGLRAEGDPLRYALTVQRSVCGRTGFLHGGCALAGAVTAMAAATGRRLVWATGQYLARAAIDEEVTFDVEPATAGNRLTHVRCVARVDDRVVATYQAALGVRADRPARQWLRAPAVAAPEDSPPAQLSWEPDGSFHSSVEARLGRIDADAGEVTLWLRLPGEMQETVAGLSVIGDYVPSAFRMVLDDTTSRASSLDITIRVVDLEPTDWVLLQLRLGGLSGGVGHGDAAAWSTSGRLLALASQSFAFSA